MGAADCTDQAYVNQKISCLSETPLQYIYPIVLSTKENCGDLKIVLNMERPGKWYQIICC